MREELEVEPNIKSIEHLHLKWFEHILTIKNQVAEKNMASKNKSEKNKCQAKETMGWCGGGISDQKR